MSGLNFLLFCLGSRYFRKELRKLLVGLNGRCCSKISSSVQPVEDLQLRLWHTTGFLINTHETLYRGESSNFPQQDIALSRPQHMPSTSSYTTRVPQIAAAAKKSSLPRTKSSPGLLHSNQHITLPTMCEADIYKHRKRNDRKVKKVVNEIVVKELKPAITSDLISRVSGTVSKSASVLSIETI